MKHFFNITEITESGSTVHRDISGVDYSDALFQVIGEEFPITDFSRYNGVTYNEQLFVHNHSYMSFCVERVS